MNEQQGTQLLEGWTRLSSLSGTSQIWAGSKSPRTGLAGRQVLQCRTAAELLNTSAHHRFLYTAGHNLKNLPLMVLALPVSTRPQMYFRD